MIVTVLDLDKLRGAACAAEYGHMRVTGDVMCALLDRLAAAERDAARYRSLRRGQRWSIVNGVGDTLRADGLDAAVDAALARKGE